MSASHLQAAYEPRRWSHLPLERPLPEIARNATETLETQREKRRTLMEVSNPSICN
ncbi:MAG: hypothetical protein HN758_17635 [Verrucomicrobia bacterium]|nr:hypothetical protein [Verrucomicrobiota bacterium]MBT5063625.1 hypothetical protein [Verrucomicrobiota bacterium]MBT7876255.1 hypothetical protein [Verrucomicrobiota bacterium]